MRSAKSYRENLKTFLSPYKTTLYYQILLLCGECQRRKSQGLNFLKLIKDSQSQLAFSFREVAGTGTC